MWNYSGQGYSRCNDSTITKEFDWLSFRTHGRVQVLGLAKHLDKVLPTQGKSGTR
jgi:hypothetical protein